MPKAKRTGYMTTKEFRYEIKDSKSAEIDGNGLYYKNLSFILWQNKKAFKKSENPVKVTITIEFEEI